MSDFSLFYMDGLEINYTIILLIIVINKYLNIFKCDIQFRLDEIIMTY